MVDIEQLIERLRLAHKHGVLAPVFGVIAPSALHSTLMERLQRLLEVDVFDTHILQPEPDKRYIKVLLARRWLRELVTSPRGTHKIGFIRQADWLEPRSSNTLLKVLEEPPANTWLILLLTQNNLLPTIRSRLHLFTIMSQPELSTMTMPNTVSAIIKMSQEWSKEKTLKQHLVPLLTTLREQLKRGEVSADYVQAVGAAYMQNSLGADQRLLTEKILLNYDL
ncbi:MAG: hypothetical protein Q7S64_03420 [bacterium]|nr:hypothetical protein [bacterium]